MKAPVSVLSKGVDQFRISAALPEGTRSWTVNHGEGWLREPDGTTRNIPYANVADLGSVTFPLSLILQALQDASVSVRDQGPTSLDGQQLYQIRLERSLDAGAPEALLSISRERNLFFDPKNLQIIKISDTMYVAENIRDPFVRDIFFEDYRTVGGLIVPFAVTEHISHQKTWTIQFEHIDLSASLSDNDFTR